MTTSKEPVDCIFCKIIRKEAPATQLFEDDKVLVFLDIRPLNEGHTLVIPKEHCETIFEMPEDLVCHLYAIVKRMSVAVRNASKADGITIIQQNGQAAGQEVFHMHVHIVPRFEGQKLPHFHDIPNASIDQLEHTARLIKQNLP